MTTDNAQEKPHIGFIGLGRMGSLMAQRLLQTGYSLQVYNRTRSKALEMVQYGANIVDQPRELSANCDVVITCLTDNRAVEEVMHSPQGILAGARSGLTLMDMSTVSPQEARHIHDLAQKKGAHMLDAAISGSTPQAEDGELIFFVGGEREYYEQCKPILDILGKANFYMGTSGMGMSMKLVVNTMLGLGIQALAEALALGEKAGLEKKLLVDVLGQTTVIAPAHKVKLENVRHGEYPVNFALATMRKDFSLIMRLAAERAVPMPATAAAEQMYAAALAQGMYQDFSVMCQFMEHLSGIH